MSKLRRGIKNRERIIENYEDLEFNKKIDFNRKLFKIMTFLNVEKILQLIYYTAQKGLTLRRNMFILHLKVRIIQTAIRKFLLNRHVINHMKNNVKVFFKEVIFRFKIRRAIRKKR